MSRKRTHAYLLLLLVSVIWGAASPVVKHTLTWFPPIVFLTYRFSISALIAVVLYQFYPVRIPKKPENRALALITALLSTPIAIGLFFVALTKTSALSGSVITAGSPILLVAAGALFLRERITRQEKFGITITIIGTIIAAIGPLIFNHTTNHVGTFEGNMIMVLATVTDLSATLLTKIGMKRGISPHLLGHAQFILGFILYLPILLIMMPFSQALTIIINAPWQAHAGVIFMSLFSGTLAYTIRNIAVQWIEVSEAALFSYLQPVWAALLAILWLGEPVTTAYILGGSFIAVGVFLSEYRRRARVAYTSRRQKSVRRSKRKRHS